MLCVNAASNETKTIVLILGECAWVVGGVLFADYTIVSRFPGMREVMVVFFAVIGALLGLLWYIKWYVGNVRCLVIRVAIGLVAELNRPKVIIPFFCGMLFIEIMTIGLRISYYRQAKKSGKQNIKKTPFIYRIQDKNMTVIIFPPVHKIREAKEVIRFWLVQLVLATASLAL